MSPRARRRHRRSHNSAGKKLVRALIAVVVCVGAAAAGATAWVFGTAAGDPSLDQVKPTQQGAVSLVLAADGSRLGYIASDTVRDPVAAAAIPQRLRQATVAIEDRNFYDHGALDYEAIARAALQDIAAGSVEEGGSTITQQLVKNLYIADPKDTLDRKIREAKLAVELEQQHSKDWILNQYLNSVSYGTNGGRTAVGAEAASQIYFGEHAADLDLRRAALLAGLPQAPTEYNPLLNPGRAKARRDDVLDAMYKQGYISRAERRRAKAAGLGLDPGSKYDTVSYPYFFDYVEGRLIQHYGVNTVRDGGLIVHTTIDPALQALAQQAVDDGAARLAGPSAALVATDVATGHVLAMASSSSYATDKFNLAAQGHRQPGSSFKPFVLATALKQGIDPNTTYYDGTSPVTLYPYGQYGEPWTVNNAEPGEGTMSLTAATTNSVNAVFAQLDLDVGPQNVAETAHSLGITSPLDGYPAEGIGGLRVGVSPLEMSDAYATFADGGVHHDSTAIDRVVFPATGGRQPRVDQVGDASGTRALSDGIAAEETDVLKTVIASGTGTAANIGCPAAGKTGTTDGQTDAWFVGYTPRISTAVWTGYPDARTSMGPSAFGGSFAAPIWHQFMAAARGSYCGDFPPPQSPASLSAFTGGHTVSAAAPRRRRP